MFILLVKKRGLDMICLRLLKFYKIVYLDMKNLNIYGFFVYYCLLWMCCLSIFI